MRSLWGLDDADGDKFGKVWLAKNAGWLEGVGCGFGGDDALAALIEPDTYDIDEMDAEHKALHIHAKACVGVQMLFLDGKQPSGETLALLRQCADADDWLAAGELGATLLFFRKDLQKDENEGITLLTKAVKLGSSRAMGNLGTAFDEGLGVEKDQKKAVEWWKRAADSGELIASASLGGFYGKHGVDVDKSKALEYCAIAADSGETTALCNLAFCYEMGSGVPQNLEKAFSLYLQAFSLSPNAKLMNNLARFYVYGIGTKQDVPKGVELFNKAIEMGNTDAMLNLGQLLVSGAIPEGDIQRGLELLRCAAGRGKQEAKILLSMAVKDSFVPIQLLQQDTTMPPFMKLYMLGIAYMKDETNKNPEMAVSSFQHGAQECEHLMDFFRDENKVVEQNKVVTQNRMKDPLFVQSVYVYYDMIMNELGNCFQKGIGVARDEEKAFACFKQGISAITPFCLCSLAKCYEKGIGVKQDEKKAFELFQSASDLEYEEGIFNLAQCYENGIGVEVNLPKAMELYCRASKLGSKKANDKLETFCQGVLLDYPKTVYSTSNVS